MTTKDDQGTPRTDAAVRCAKIAGLVPTAVVVECSEQIELENNALQAKLAEVSSGFKAARMLANIYRGAATAFTDCEVHKDVIAQHCPVCLIGERDTLRAQLEQANERLENNRVYVDDGNGELVRKDVEPGSIPDGIECRDETIRLQDEQISRLRSELSTKSKEVEELREQLSSWAKHAANLGLAAADVIKSAQPMGVDLEELRNKTLEEAAQKIRTEKVYHGDQYGGYSAVSSDAEELARAVLSLKSTAPQPAKVDK